MKNILLLFFISFLTACVSAEKCRNAIPSSISFKNLQHHKNDTASLIVLDTDGERKEGYPFEISRYFEENNETVLGFKTPNKLNGRQTYKLTHNQNVFFIYDFKVSQKKHLPQYCSMNEPKFKINNCSAAVHLYAIDKSCGIPASEADAYFKKYVQTTMK